MLLAEGIPAVFSNDRQRGGLCRPRNTNAVGGAMKEKFIEAGEIVNTHGVRGEVSIFPWTDSAEFLRRFKTLYIDEKPMTVTASRIHKNRLLVHLEGVADVSEAMRLKGKVVKIDRQDARLPEGAYFLQDLMGARVLGEDGAEIGVLTEIIETPANQIYVVRGAAEHLIPAVPEFIMSTDADTGTIIVRLIEGM